MAGNPGKRPMSHKRGKLEKDEELIKPNQVTWVYLGLSKRGMGGGWGTSV